MNDLTIEQVRSEADSARLYALLWEVLWKPLGFPRNVRELFKLEGESLAFIAKSQGELQGGLVASWTSPTEVELCHIGLKPEAQNQGVGRQLVNVLLGTLAQSKCARIHVIARNTSAGFFRKLGFTTSPGKSPQHPVFAKQGIRFELLEMDVEQPG